jgi:hypothetical protein
MLDLK